MLYFTLLCSNLIDSSYRLAVMIVVILNEMMITKIVVMIITMIIAKMIIVIIIIFSQYKMQTRIKERASRLEDAEKVKQDNRLVHTHFVAHIL